jgi:ribosome-binding ATPase YchF (GTP1/OBG family)
MVRKFTETPIPLCGKNLYFKRCRMEDLKKFDEQLQNKLKEMKPIQDELELLQSDEKTLVKKINNFERKIDIIEMKEEPSDKELDLSLEYLDKQEKCLDELKSLKKQIAEHDESHEEDYLRIQEETTLIMAKKVEAMLDGITAEEFLKEYDPIDIRVAGNLTNYYQMCMLGEKESKIRRQIQLDIEAQNERMESFQRS